jgi:hypothetical protein
MKETKEFIVKKQTEDILYEELIEITLTEA